MGQGRGLGRGGGEGRGLGRGGGAGWGGGEAGGRQARILGDREQELEVPGSSPAPLLTLGPGLFPPWIFLPYLGGKSVKPEGSSRPTVTGTQGFWDRRAPVYVHKRRTRIAGPSTQHPATHTPTTSPGPLCTGTKGPVHLCAWRVRHPLLSWGAWCRGPSCLCPPARPSLLWVWVSRDSFLPGKPTAGREWSWGCRGR